MKRTKVIMIICIILVITLIGLISALKILNRKAKMEFIPDEQDMGVEEFSEDIIEQVAYSEWFQVKQSINEYLDTINKENSAYYGKDENNNYVKVIEESEVKNKIYSLLSKNYIKENNVNVENVYNYIDDITKKQIYTILDIKKIVKSDYNYYIVQGFIEEENKFKCMQNFIVNFNLKEAIFSIEPLKENIEISNVQIKETEIIQNEYNKIPAVLASNENIVKEYFNMMKRTMQIYPEKAYEYLDEEYRNKRFINYEEFQKYIEDNKEKYATMQIDRYQKTETDEYTQYVCLDKNKNYYIIREKEILDYSIILDIYTIDLPEFIKKYNESNTQAKIELNINKFISGINDKNYNYSYSILAESFKQNKYKNIDIFEKFAKENLYESNKVEFKEFTQQGTNYVYKIEIRDEETNEQKDMTVVMKLHEGTQFEMSFSIE